MFKAITKFIAPKEEGRPQCPVYLKLPWIGNTSLKFQKQIKTMVNSCNRFTEFRIFFIKSILPVIHKDAVLSLEQSNVEYVCRSYFGRTFQRPLDRIKLHVPNHLDKVEKRKASINTKMQDNSFSPPNCDLAIGQIYLKIKTRTPLFLWLSILSVVATAKSSIHLGTLEATCTQN